MADLLLRGTNESFSQAHDVYGKGAFSMPFADLTLEHGLPRDVPHATHIQGNNAKGETVKGKAMGAKVNATKLMVLYEISEVQESYVNCQVGGNPNPNLEGCKYE